MMLRVKNVCFDYGKQEVLKNIDFSIEANQFVSILGANGVGKSTLFKCILGLLKSYKGDIEINGENTMHLKATDIAKLVAYIPQSHNPVFTFSVRDMVLMGTSRSLSVLSSPRKKQLEIVEEALDKMGITYLINKEYTKLSGGQRQLVLIARALAQQSRLLIFDEPTANLDYGNQIKVLSKIKELTKEGYTIIQSTHNPEQSYMYSDRILAMKDGRITLDGPSKDVINSNIIKNLYDIDATVEKLYDDKIRTCVPISIIEDKCVNI